MKIKHFLPLLLLLGSNEMLTAQEIALTPQPAHLTVKDGRFEFGNQLKAKVAPYQGDSIRMVFESFKKELQEATGIKVSSTQKEAKARIILDLNPQLPAEAYKLNVSKEQVRIEASRPAGFYYALQTLKQLMPRNVMAGVATSDHSQWSLPSVEIEDAPRFEWRGFMLDEGRHFFGKDKTSDRHDGHLQNESFPLASDRRSRLENRNKEIPQTDGDRRMEKQQSTCIR